MVNEESDKAEGRLVSLEKDRKWYWRAGVNRRQGLETEVEDRFGSGGWSKTDLVMSLSGQRFRLLISRMAGKAPNVENLNSNSPGKESESVDLDVMADGYAKIQEEISKSGFLRPWASWVDNLKYKGGGCDFDVIGGEELELFHKFADHAKPVVLRLETTEAWGAWSW